MRMTARLAHETKASVSCLECIKNVDAVQRFLSFKRFHHLQRTKSYSDAAIEPNAEDAGRHYNFVPATREVPGRVSAP